MEFGLFENDRGGNEGSDLWLEKGDSCWVGFPDLDQTDQDLESTQTATPE